MINRFFFITSYDCVSGSLLGTILNEHPDIHCNVSMSDPFLNHSNLSDNDTHHAAVDKTIEQHQRDNKLFSGDAQRFSAFELQHRLLAEKVKQPVRRVNLILAPAMRVNFLLASWKRDFGSTARALEHIEKQMHALQQQTHGTFKLYVFQQFYASIFESAAAENIDATKPENKLFLIALAKMIAFDSADLRTASKHFNFEKLIGDESYLTDFLHYLTYNQIQINDTTRVAMRERMAEAASIASSLCEEKWADWQYKLLNEHVQTHLQNVIYTYIDKPLLEYYRELGCTHGLTTATSKSLYSKLISIQLNSNRPAQLAAYFDNIEETAEEPEQIEVLVNYDIGDTTMEQLLQQEAVRRKFTIKYISSPRPASFCDLWIPINSLLKITDPNSYFLLNISDEMLFAEKAWDAKLEKYVGFFPDHIFRLRASRNKFRNYFDRWECSFVQDSIPITTKRWVETGGNWNPCFGPDSFQQLVAFYLAKESGFSHDQTMSRDIPVIDIRFLGDTPDIGIDANKAWKHTSDHIRAMQICQSHAMQQEARRRAMLLKANIIAAAQQLNDFTVVDITAKKQIHLISDNQVIAKISYKLNWFAITLTNQLRKLYFHAYFGGGKAYKKKMPVRLAGYLKAKHRGVNQFYLSLKSLIRAARRQT